MSYVPGFQHDVFVSYAHGDDRGWTEAFTRLLQTQLDRQLGTVTDVWLDTEDNRRSRDFSREIPDAVRSSAVFLILSSPSYIRSHYCIEVECRAFSETLPDRRSRFDTPEFANELFAFRCPVLFDGTEHWDVFQGLTDIAFGDESIVFPVGSTSFKKSFGRLAGELSQLLRRMRNHSSAVFLYPPFPGEDIRAAHAALKAELEAQSYRVLPDRLVNLPAQLREAAVAVFLLGEQWDDKAPSLIDIVASEGGKPWLVWCSPSISRAPVDQLGFQGSVEQLDSAMKTYLGPGILPAKLKEEVLALLRPARPSERKRQDKPSVYLVYNARDDLDRKNAGLISYTFRQEIQFEHPDSPAEHTRRIAQSDGVLLIWGNADEEWCSREFLEVVQASRRAHGRGLCVFDPREPKAGALDEIRRAFGDRVYIGEQFGRFDPARLEPFFRPLRSSQDAGV